MKAAPCVKTADGRAQSHVKRDDPGERGRITESWLDPVLEKAQDARHRWKKGFWTTEKRGASSPRTGTNADDAGFEGRLAGLVASSGRIRWLQLSHRTGKGAGLLGRVRRVGTL